MNLAIILTFLCASAFAAEVSTDCPAMNGSREKIVKESVSKKGKIRGSRVVSQ